MFKKNLVSAAILLCLCAFNTADAQKNQPRFINDIEVGFPQQGSVAQSKGPKNEIFENQYIVSNSYNEYSIENASSLQFKYALLLDTEVEEVNNLSLFNVIDDWYGTRYRLGGSTKNGIDCSAFTQTVFADAFGLTLPRTAREQYAALNHISRTELKEGDLVFFNTTGGVSHVGIYLQNNKFVHAASSGGVMISDLYDGYWSRRFVGVGRYGAGASSQVQP